MKHLEESPVKAKDGSPLPRFLRGLFGSRDAQPAVLANPPAPTVLPVPASEKIPAPDVAPESAEAAVVAPEFAEVAVVAPESAEVAVIAPKSAEVAVVAPAIQPVDGRRPKILVVDDDPVILKTIGIKLSRAGCEVITGKDGSEAVTTARKEQPDVIVLDVNFPPEVALAWDGIGVMKWLQRLENGETPPVIIITALGSEQIRQKAMAAGAIAFFQKPIDNDGLIQVINKTLDLRRASGQPAKSADSAI